MLNNIKIDEERYDLSIYNPKHMKKVIEWIFEVCEDMGIEECCAFLAVKLFKKVLFMKKRSYNTRNYQNTAWACIILSINYDSYNKKIIKYINDWDEKQKVKQLSMEIFKELDYNIHIITLYEYFQHLNPDINLDLLFEECKRVELDTDKINMSDLDKKSIVFESTEQKEKK